MQNFRSIMIHLDLDSVVLLGLLNFVGRFIIAEKLCCNIKDTILLIQFNLYGLNKFMFKSSLRKPDKQIIFNSKIEIMFAGSRQPIYCMQQKVYLTPEKELHMQWIHIDVLCYIIHLNIYINIVCDIYFNPITITISVF